MNEFHVPTMLHLTRTVIQLSHIRRGGGGGERGGSGVVDFRQLIRPEKSPATAARTLSPKGLLHRPTDWEHQTSIHMEKSDPPTTADKLSQLGQAGAANKPTMHSLHGNQCFSSDKKCCYSVNKANEVWDSGKPTAKKKKRRKKRKKMAWCVWFEKNLLLLPYQQQKRCYQPVPIARADPWRGVSHPDLSCGACVVGYPTELFMAQQNSIRAVRIMRTQTASINDRIRTVIGQTEEREKSIVPDAALSSVTFHMS